MCWEHQIQRCPLISGKIAFFIFSLAWAPVNKETLTVFAQLLSSFLNRLNHKFHHINVSKVEDTTDMFKTRKSDITGKLVQCNIAREFQKSNLMMTKICSVSKSPQRHLGTCGSCMRMRNAGCGCGNRCGCGMRFPHSGLRVLVPLNCL